MLKHLCRKPSFARAHLRCWGLFELQNYLQCASFILAAAVMFAAGDQADAETFDDWCDGEEVSYESDKFWNRATRSTSGPAVIYLADTRVALREDQYAPRLAGPILAQT